MFGQATVLLQKRANWVGWDLKDSSIVLSTLPNNSQFLRTPQIVQIFKLVTVQKLLKVLSDISTAGAIGKRLNLSKGSGEKKEKKKSLNLQGGSIRRAFFFAMLWWAVLLAAYSISPIDNHLIRIKHKRRRRRRRRDGQWIGLWRKKKKRASRKLLLNACMDCRCLLPSNSVTELPKHH